MFWEVKEQRLGYFPEATQLVNAKAQALNPEPVVTLGFGVMHGFMNMRQFSHLMFSLNLIGEVSQRQSPWNLEIYL